MNFDTKFTATVSVFCTEFDHVNVAFEKYAAMYTLSAERDDFIEQLVRIANSWKSHKPVRVGLGIGMDIKSIDML